MAKIVRYNGNLVPFASSSLGTERTIFGQVTQANDITSQYTAEFLRGWGIVGPSDQPTLQDFNAVSYTHGQILSYLHQVGIAEFNSAQEYHLGSVTNYSGVIYTSLTNSNVGNTPASSPANWRSIENGRIARRSVYRNNGGTLQVSIDGGAFVTAASTFTPATGAVNALVEVIGAGGGGGGCGGTGVGQVAAAGGGAGGGYASSLLSVAAITGQTLVVGAGGTSSVNAAGTAGGSASIGSLLSATGGGGGTIGTPIATPSGTSLAGGTAGGVGTNGNILNAQGGFGNYGAQAPTPISGAGGSSLAGAGAVFVSGTTNGIAAVSPGSGGSGSALLSSIGGGATGGAGASARITIVEFF